MNYHLHLEKLQHLVHLINLKATGKPKDLATKLNISERTLYRLLAHLKDNGALIRYCPILQSYLCDNKIELHYSFKVF